MKDALKSDPLRLSPLGSTEIHGKPLLEDDGGREGFVFDLLL